MLITMAINVDSLSLSSNTQTMFDSVFFIKGNPLVIAGYTI